MQIQDNTEQTRDNFKGMRRDYTLLTWNGEDIVQPTTLKSGHGDME
jgi:hypothetical protein